MCVNKRGQKKLSHIVEKNGKKTLFCFYDPEKDDYNEALDIATQEHNLEGQRFNAICKPFKKQRSPKEKKKALQRKLETLFDRAEAEGRELSFDEHAGARELMQKQHDIK